MFCVLLHSSQPRAGTLRDTECYKKEMQPIEKTYVVVNHCLFSVGLLRVFFSKDNRHRDLRPHPPSLLFLVFLNKTVYLYHSDTLEDAQVDIKPTSDGISKDTWTQFFV
jgi:hypothetical protein